MVDEASETAVCKAHIRLEPLCKSEGVWVSKCLDCGQILASQEMARHGGSVQWSKSIEVNTLFAGFALLKKALDGRAFAAECPNCGSIQPIEAKDCGEDGPCYVCLTCEVDWHFPLDDSETTEFNDGDDIPF